MGSVEDIVTTGDNDEPIFPIKYYNYYMYCDACGSFELRHWMGPENHADIERLVGRLKQIRNGALAATAVSLIIAFFGMPLCLGAALLILIGTAAAAEYFGGKIEVLGVRCEACGATYKHGSSFFTDFKENPRNFTMADVPRPLYNVYQIRGEEIGPA